MSVSSSSSSSSSSSWSRRGAANFTGNWLMDVNASDSLQPLLFYHGMAITPITALTVQNVVEIPSPLNNNNSSADSHASSSSSSITTTTSISQTQLQTSSDGVHTNQIRMETAALGLGGVAESLVNGSSSSSLSNTAFLATPSFTPATLPTIADSPAASFTSALQSVNEEHSTVDHKEEDDDSEISTNTSTTSSSASTTQVDSVNSVTTTETSVSTSSTSLASSSSSTSSTSSTSPSSLLTSTSTSLPALIVQHSTRRLTTYLHNLIPRYNEKGVLIRYDPVQNSKLDVHEEYKIDGEYHMIHTARGKVEARCYSAPHGQSVVVDTRCASKYDLERTERFLEDDGKVMVIEIRILSCAPEWQNKNTAQTTAKGTAVAPNQVVVKELLFLRRVFRRIMDADPAAAAKAAAASVPSTPSSSVVLPAFGSGINKSIEEEPSSATAANSFNGGKLDFDSEEVTSHHSPVKKRVVETSFQSTASLPSFSSHILTKTQRIGMAPSAMTAGSTALIHKGAHHHANVWSILRDTVLYPRMFLLRRYQLSELLINDESTTNNNINSKNANMQAAIAHETTVLISARRSMLLVDLAFVLFIVLFLLIRFDCFSSITSSSAADASASSQIESALNDSMNQIQQAAAHTAAAHKLKHEL